MGEVAIGEMNVLNMAIGTTLDHRHSAGEGVNTVEIDIADTLATVMLCNLQPDGVHIVTVNGDIGEGEIFNQGILDTLVRHTQFVGIAGKTHSDARAGLGDVQIGEGHIPHNAVVYIADPDSAGVAGQVAVGDGNTLADGIFVEGSAVSTDNNTVVATGDIAVGDSHIGAAVDMNAVVVGDIHSGADLQPVKADVIAIADPVTPAAPLVCHSDFFHCYIFAANEEYHTGRSKTCLTGVQIVGICTNVGVRVGQGNKVGGQRHRRLPVGHMRAVVDLLLGHRSHVVGSLTVNGAATGDTDILTAFSINKAALVKAYGVFCAPKIGLDLREILVVGGSQQNGVPFNMQVNTVFHIDPAAEELAVLQDDLATAVGGAIVDGGLDGDGVKSCAVTLGTVSFYIAV